MADEKVTVSMSTVITIHLNAEVRDYSSDTPIGHIWNTARAYEGQLTDILKKALDGWKVGDINVVCQPETRWMK